MFNNLMSRKNDAFLYERRRFFNLLIHKIKLFNQTRSQMLIFVLLLRVVDNP